MIQKIKSYIVQREEYSQIKKFCVTPLFIKIAIGSVLLILIWFFTRSIGPKPSRILQTQENLSEAISNASQTPRYERAQYENMQSYLTRNNPVHSSFLGNSQILTNQEVDDNMKLLSGTLIPAITLNKIVSGDVDLPTLAIVTEDIYHPITSLLAIPHGSKLIGQTSYDEKLKRIYVHFNTLISPSQKKLSLSGLALDKKDEASSGLSGKYHSEELKRIAGQILSTFVAGAATQLKEAISGPFGLSVSNNSLSNALLEGVSQASLSQGQRFTESLKNTQGYVEVSQGTPILVFLTSDFLFDYE